ncbi:right-handed parallel beta-helix repeat-containing protein [Pontiella sp.]|uniref:right-handed parallel beta-helix repeat-containing protein n=1 Tax=Pontiella sp. TaxID=2837462 RepID=UPI00356AFE94
MKFIFPLITATLLSLAGTAAAQTDFIEIDSLDALRSYLSADDVKIRMKPGTYRIDDAPDHHFFRFTGSRTRFDLTGVTFEIDNRLFSKFGVVPGKDGFYCVIDLIGDSIHFEGLTTRNTGPENSAQSRNKIFNVVGSKVTLQDIDITTSGSSPWGYGSLYGLGGGVVRKMNGIRVGWPAQNSKLINCRVHMRAMGHAIFVQGAAGTLIENCHIDGLLRTTDEILAEESGFAFDRNFKARSGGYVEGVCVGEDGTILPGEMIALSEDGIRMYGHGGEDRVPTGNTTIRNCTVRQMRRGICTGLGPGADTVINCEVTDCVAAGFNIGNGDILQACRANARYAEALSCPYYGSANAAVELSILDSRNGRANTVLATINGTGHTLRLTTPDPDFVPAHFTIEQATNKGYAFYQKKQGRPVAEAIHLDNQTPAQVSGR